MKILRTVLNFCDNDYIENHVKVRDHYYITGKYRVSAHRDCNINLKLNHKIPIVFHNLKYYDTHLILFKRKNPANSCLLKVNNRNTKERCELCSKLTIKNTRTTSLTLYYSSTV